MTEVGFVRLPRLFVRLCGRNDSVREYSALVSPSAEYSILPKVDAFRLGYAEAARENLVTMPPNLLRGLTYDGYWEGMMIQMKEVTVSGSSVFNVPFVAFDLPQLSCFDVILGMPLLRSLSVQINCSKGVITLPRAGSEARA